MLRTLLAIMLIAAASPASAETKSAIFAGGCFWCVESDFDKVKGVVATTSGYSGGDLQNPTYENHEGHREVVKIDYDPAVVGYDELLRVFFRSVDPTDGGGQFCDRGYAYGTAVFAADDAELAKAKAAAEEAGTALKQPIATQIAPAKQFWTAEDYHQNYYKENPIRYKYYRNACGRDDRIEQLWGDQAHAGIDGHS